MTSKSFRRTAIGAAASFAVILPLTACASSNAADARSPSPQPTTTPRGGESPTGTQYRDGVYTVRGVYGGAPSYITVTLTLTANTVSDVKAGLMPDNNDTSRGYQERFAAAVADRVEGKPITRLSVNRIAGASGCSDGFNDALRKIRDEASMPNDVASKSLAP
ncbi:hypothetical protein [Microbacterium mangrovi]|uniref:hypothetical protein n=1 Tax=Microbacterium mangrovi TaxID=1348253 RepID=UPI001E53D468|nr:hypothetical protein [Microbacterium mangrovi]